MCVRLISSRCVCVCVCVSAPPECCALFVTPFRLASIVYVCVCVCVFVCTSVCVWHLSVYFVSKGAYWR